MSNHLLRNLPSPYLMKCWPFHIINSYVYVKFLIEKLCNVLAKLIGWETAKEIKDRQTCAVTWVFYIEESFFKVAVILWMLQKYRIRRENNKQWYLKYTDILIQIEKQKIISDTWHITLRMLRIKTHNSLKIFGICVLGYLTQLPWFLLTRPLSLTVQWTMCCI